MLKSLLYLTEQKLGVQGSILTIRQQADREQLREYLVLHMKCKADPQLNSQQEHSSELWVTTVQTGALVKDRRVC